jgi:hypothetical protein
MNEIKSIGFSNDIVNNANIKYADFGDMIVASEWISGKTDKKKYLKWLKSNKSYQHLRQTFLDTDIERYIEYIEIVRKFDNENLLIGKINIWIVDKYLHVTTNKNNVLSKNNERFNFILLGKPLQKNYACEVKNIGIILKSIEHHNNFGEFLETIMKIPENNHQWVSMMKTRLILDGKLYSEHEDQIDKNKFDIFEFIAAYQNDPIIIKWSQHCGLVCVAKGLVN